MQQLPSKRFIRRRAVLEMTGLSNTSLYELIGEGEFPRPKRLSEKRALVAWDESEVLAWMDSRSDTVPQTATATLKTCAGCGEEKLTTHYHASRAHTDGLHPRCKRCVIADARQKAPAPRKRRCAA